MRPKFKDLQKEARNSELFITVDTGLNTSCALWKKHDHTGHEIELIKSIKVPAKMKDSMHRVFYIAEHFNKLIEEWSYYYPEIETIFLEGVSFWSGSLKSDVSAKTGSLSLLSYIVGALIHVCLTNRIDCYDVLFQEWGGQLKPGQVQNRVKAITNITCENQHQYDAMGMGLSLLGKFGR